MFSSISAGRVLLRRLRPTDLPAFAAYRADPAVVRYQGFDAYSAEQAASFLAAQYEAAVPPPPGDWVQLAIARAADDYLLGDCALHLAGHDPRLGEVGITLAAAAQGQGYAHEALTALLGYCFQQLRLHRVAANVDPRNQTATRLLEGMGMRREGHGRQNGWYKGEWCDEYHYALLRSEWPPRP